MTGKERILAALEGRPTDRIPILVPMYDGYIARAAGRVQWEFDYGTADEQLAMQIAAMDRHPENDGFYTWTGTNRGPLSGVRVERRAGKPFAVYDSGAEKELDDNPSHGLWNRSPEETRKVNEAHRVADRADIDRKLGPVVPASELLYQPGYQVLARLAKAVGHRTFLLVNHSSLFASAAIWLGGPEEAWMRTATEPDLVAAVLDRILAQHVEHVIAASEAGGHALWHTYMYEGANILSPATWRALVKPRAAEIVAEAHRRKIKDIAWFLDDARPLLPDLIEIGTDGIATEAPRGNYACEPGDLRRIAGDNRFCIFGWFHDDDLIHGDRAAIRRTLRKQRAEAGAGKPFVVSTPGITQEVSPETVDDIVSEALASG